MTAADGERRFHCRVQGAGAAEGNRRQQHGRHQGHGVGLEEVRRHAGAVTDVVAHVVGDDRGVAGVVLGDAGLDLADEVGADIGALGEDAAAEAREDGNQRTAEGQRHESLDQGAIWSTPTRSEDPVVASHSEETESRPPACR